MKEKFFCLHGKRSPLLKRIRMRFVTKYYKYGYLLPNYPLVIPQGSQPGRSSTDSREIICALAADSRQALSREENQAQSARRAQEKQG